MIYFHGSLAEYVRMDTRQLLPIQNIMEIDPVEFLNGQADNIDFPEDKQDCKTVIPSMVPPLKLKPVLSSKYIEIWHEAFEWIRQADLIVIVGYSFNNADEHFNDILRKVADNKTIYIVGPNVLDPSFLKRMEKVLHIPVDNWVNDNQNGTNSKVAKKVHLIKGFAIDIDFDSFDQN